MKSMGLNSGSSANSEKKIIHYARFGKILNVKKPLVYIQLLFSVVISLILLLNLKEVSHLISYFSIYFLNDARILEETVASFFKLNYIGYSGRFPSLYESVIYIFISLIFILYIPKVNLLSAPIKIYVQFFFLVLLCSSLFFYLVPYKFPYSSNNFSLLYMTIQVGILSFIPVVLGFALSLLNVSTAIFFLNILITFITLIYSFVFGVVRYIAMLYLLDKLSYIWMANFFFNLGPLLDMIYISSIYSFYLSILSEKYATKIAYWRWVY